MKKLSVGLALALCVVGCKKKKDEENKEPAPAPAVQEGSGMASGAAMAGSAAMAPAEATMTGKDLADKYVKCVGMINDGKFDDFTSSCIAADYKGHDMDGEEMSGADGIKKEFTMLKTAFPDWKLTPQLVIVDGRNILAVELSQGTNSGPMKMGPQEMPATNKKMGTLMFHRLAINDQNKATEEWAYQDPMTMMGQLGMMPKGAMQTREAIDKSWDGAPNITVTADNDTEKKNIEAVKKMDDAFNAHKIPDLLASLSDDAVESDQADGKDAKGKKEIEAGLKMFFAGFPDVKATMDQTYAAGDYVVQMGTMTGTNKGDMGPMKKTGKEINGHFAEISKWKDGKVTNLWRFRNGMAMAMQLGLMPAPGAAPAAGSAAPAGAPAKK